MTPVMHLLTSDPNLEDTVADALSKTGGTSYLTRSADEALQIVCETGCRLDIAMIDFELGPHGMTLLRAISACRKDLSVIAVTGVDEEHVKAVAYANGACLCLSKPPSVAQISAAIGQTREPQHQVASQTMDESQ